MKGTSYTYFTTDNAKQARELIGILREANATVPPQLEEMAMYSGGGGGRSTYIPRRAKFYHVTDMILVGRYGGGRGRGGGGGGRFGGGGGGHDNGYGGRAMAMAGGATIAGKVVRAAIVSYHLSRLLMVIWRV